MKGRLNVFQVAMLRWRELHPYNAIHVIDLDLALDQDRLRTAIAETLEAQGLTGLELDEPRRRYEYRGGAAVPQIEFAHTGDSPDSLTQQLVEQNLNHAFPRTGPLDPFRFFVVPLPQGFRLGLVYDHFIAGGDSIVVLLRAIVERLAGRPLSLQPFDRYPPTYRGLVLRNAVRMLAAIVDLWRVVVSCRRGIRPRAAAPGKTATGQVGATLDAAATQQLLRTAKAWGVTVNDLLIALLLSRLAAELVPRADAKVRKRARNEIGVASVVSLRTLVAAGPDTVFGQFLTSFRIAHAVPPDLPLQQMTQDIHADTEQAKKLLRSLQSLVVIGGGGLFWPHLSDAQRLRFNAKNYPVWSGLTTVDARRLWPPTAPVQPLRYFRAVPTGPLAPMVMAATTFGDQIELNVSWRLAAYAREDMTRFMASLVTAVSTLRA